jgi:pimeloyl-ACP methyl ester carboxylesterase
MNSSTNLFVTPSVTPCVTQEPQAPASAVFEVFGRCIAAKRWGNADGEPTIALHGWLDNANTFDRLAPFLPELNLVALDFAGHGLSDHRPAGVHYQSLDDIQDVLAVAQQLGWDKFNVIGHSMGGAIASEMAALFPERIIRAVHIDGFIATGGATVAERIDQSRKGIQRMLAAQSSSQKVFASVEAMAIRVTEATDQSLEAARVLVARGHKVVAGGVTWRTDSRIRFPTPLRPSREHINLLLQDSSAPALLLVAEQGDSWYRGEIEDAQAHHPQLTVKRMQGPHHIHLEPLFVDQVIAATRDFLQLDI